MFCKKCNTEISDKSIFCNHCGQKVDLSNEPNQDISEEPEESLNKSKKLESLKFT
ncbi:MAG: hypothetical protein C0594_14265 [Marinilabiliales bacterium]|nr:MAG: hypothetical protein C0594_14265 [Marinilabiliales bacterium]